VKSINRESLSMSSANSSSHNVTDRDIHPNITTAMPKALTFKGDKPKPKKRKRTQEEKDDGPSTKQLVPSGDAPAEADLAGPVMLVFPSEPVMSLACDRLGTVFASKVENMVEGVASSAEPHDVRQVFVATRVVGSETDIVLKGCNGR
jgi:protein FRG1